MRPVVMISAQKRGAVSVLIADRGPSLTNLDHEKKIEDARSLLESVTLLEVVAAEREAKAGNLMESLVDDGLQPEEVAERLDISEQSVESILSRDEPKPPHERIGISEESVEKLDPVSSSEPKFAAGNDTTG
jgi:hypothetical protein